MYLSQITIQNFRQFGTGGAGLSINLQPGVTALVGPNDSGKTALIDAIRYALLTHDQEFIRVQPDDFYISPDGHQASEIYILCKLTNLSDPEKGAFLEYLSYEVDEVSLYVHWSARKLSEAPGARRWVDVSVRSGRDGTGPTLDRSVRELLSAAYLRPLRDAEREMSPGRSSRLSQILSNVPKIKDGTKFDKGNIPKDVNEVKKLGLLGLADYMSHNIREHSGVKSAEKSINDEYLKRLSLRGDDLKGKIDVAEGGTESARFQQILERLELGLLNAASGNPLGRYGLGSNNLLFMACELLLLGKEPEGLPLLLIEEPEAHLHPQRQLRLMDFLQQASEGKIEGADRYVQVLLSTHSPNLASKIPVEKLILLHGKHAFSLAEGQTRLETGDYRFLRRFLDTTKANLFFAHGVLIVEGPAEAILLPVLAKLMGRDLTEHGVSIVNVGGTGLCRFSRIFQRQNDEGPKINVPVACLADMDVMPDCAPKILDLVEGDEDPKWKNPKRRWKAMRDFGSDPHSRNQGFLNQRARLKGNDGQSVRTFVADHWTLEYDLARCGLAEQVFTAAILAKNDDPLNTDKKKREDVVAQAATEFAILKSNAGDDDVLCSQIYLLFHSGTASKAITAQYLAELLPEHCNEKKIDPVAFRDLLPAYLREAIEYLTPQPAPEVPRPELNGGDRA